MPIFEGDPQPAASAAVYVAGAALGLASGFAASRLARSSGGAGGGRRALGHVLALAGAGSAAWLLPGIALSIAPWAWLALCYLWGLGAASTRIDPGPTGRVHGEHAPRVRGETRP